MFTSQLLSRATYENKVQQHTPSSRSPSGSYTSFENSQLDIFDGLGFLMDCLLNVLGTTPKIQLADNEPRYYTVVQFPAVTSNVVYHLDRLVNSALGNAVRILRLFINETLTPRLYVLTMLPCM
jgi:hypothetical protein